MKKFEFKAILFVIIMSILILLSGCNPMKMISSPYGKIYRYQKTGIEEAREFKAPRPIKSP
ncbi:MAG: hypothetical protein IID16_00905 [Candidatus Marinimicrobia bacterium]|nr:hypothetical protein [Candidatus Neomarinimicrobiota bacterium]